MEGKEDDVTLIFGRDILATRRAIIDVEAGELTLRVKEEQVKFNDFNSMKLPNATHECYFIDECEKLV